MRSQILVRGFKSGGNVHRIADSREFKAGPPADISHECLARVDANSGRPKGRPIGCEPLTESFSKLVNGHGTFHRSLRGRGSLRFLIEHRDHRVTDKFVDLTAILKNQAAESVEVSIENGDQLFGVSSLGKFRVVGDIRE